MHAGGAETLLDTILDFCDEAAAAGADCIHVNVAAGASVPRRAY